MNRALLEQALDALTYQGAMGPTRRQRRVAAIEALKAELERPESEKAYICNGCGAIYWESNVSCDCEVPALNQFTQADVYTKGTTNV